LLRIFEPLKKSERMAGIVLLGKLEAGASICDCARELAQVRNRQSQEQVSPGEVVKKLAARFHSMSSKLGWVSTHVKLAEATNNEATFDLNDSVVLRGAWRGSGG
jgi:hypothetical protein